MEVFTIGFTQSSAEDFFGRLRVAGVQRLLDIRLHNDSQLAGFAKARDLEYFLRELCGATYERELLLAPSEELFAAVKKHGLPWPEYEARFRALMVQHNVPAVIDPAPFQARTVLLCSEPTPDHCHRRIVAELLAAAWGASVVHL